MSCSSAEALFEGYLDGVLAAREQRRVVAHVESCGPCRGVLEELRAVDTLLSRPCRIDLGPGFTHATMAQARSLKAPCVYRIPLRAYVVSYLAASWLVAGAGVLFVPQTMRALGGTLFGITQSTVTATSGIGAVVSRSFVHGASVLSALLISLLALDVVLVVGCGAALRFLRPASAEHRS